MPDTLIINNDQSNPTRANFSGFLDYQQLDSNETQYKLQMATVNGLDAQFWVDKEDIETNSNIDPSKLIKWLLKQLNKALNGQDKD